MTRARSRENARLVTKLAVVVAGALIASACANDFDALFDKAGSKTAVDSGKTSSGTDGTDGTSGDVIDKGDDDDIPLPGNDGGDKVPTTCAATTCTATKTSADKENTVIADQCCSYDTTCTPSGFGTTCTTTCSNGAVCKGDCRAGDCNYGITGSSLDSDCKGAFCAVKCTAKSQCNLLCDATDGCDVSCDDTSRCIVSNCFGGGGFCKVRCANGAEAESCGNGIKACGGCP